MSRENDIKEVVNLTIDTRDMANRLNNWCKQRSITLEVSRKGYVANIFEELSEYCRSIEIEDRIDALADICVFSLNNMGTIPDFIDIKESNEGFLYGFNEAFNEKYIKEIDNDNGLKLDNACENLIKIAFSEINKLGFDVYLTMNETIKEIESRTGYLDNGIGKFVKYEGAYTLEELLNRYDGKYSSHADEKSKWVLTLHDGNIKDIVKWYRANYKQCRKNVL